MKVNKNDQVVWYFVYAIFFFGFLIAFILPETILVHLGQSSIIPSVIKYAECSVIPIRVTAFFNFMWLYLIVPVLAIGFFHKYKPENNQQKFSATLFLILLIPIAIILLYYVSILSSPSCVNDNLYQADRKVFHMVNNQFSLWLRGSMLMSGLSIILGMIVLFLRAQLTK